MIPYLLLIASSLGIVAMSLLRKEYDKRSPKGLGASFGFIAISFSIISLICLAFLAISGELAVFAQTDSLVIILGVAYCLATFITTVICIVSASYGSVAIIVASANIGIITMSTLYGLIFDAERNKPNVFTWLGLALVVSIVVFNVLENGKDDTAADKKKSSIFKLFCLGAFLSNGPALVLFSMLTKYRPSFGGTPFLLVYSVPCVPLALLGLLVIQLLDRKKAATVTKKEEMVTKTAEGTPRMSGISLLLITLYSAFTLMSEFLSLINTAELPIIVQSPLSFAIPVILLTVAERIFYKTPITKSTVIKLVLSFLACAMFALAAM